MARVLLVCGLAFCGFASGAVYVARPRIPEALFCEQPVLDLGELQQTQHATGSFTLFNGSRKTVKILGITETCACSVTQVSSRIVEPGATTEVNVKWGIGSRRGDSDVVLSVVWAAEDESVGGTIPLTLRGCVIPEYDVEPLEPKFEVGVSERQVVKFAPHRMKEVHVKDVLCSHACLSARILEDRTSVEITLRADRWSKRANFSPWVTVTTNSDVLPTIQLWCTIK